MIVKVDQHTNYYEETKEFFGICYDGLSFRLYCLCTGDEFYSDVKDYAERRGKI